MIGSSSTKSNNNVHKKNIKISLHKSKFSIDCLVKNIKENKNLQEKKNEL